MPPGQEDLFGLLQGIDSDLYRWINLSHDLYFWLLFLLSVQPFSNEKIAGIYADHFMEEQVRLAKAVFLFADENRTVYPKKTGYTFNPYFPLGKNGY